MRQMCDTGVRDRQTGRQIDKQTYKWLPTKSAYSTMTCIHSAHNPVTSILPRQSQWQGAVGMGFGESCTPERCVGCTFN